MGSHLSFNIPASNFSNEIILSKCFLSFKYSPVVELLEFIGGVGKSNNFKSTVE